MRILVLLTLVLGLAHAAHACEVCGCSARDQRLGVLPDYRRNVVALSYSHRSFSSSHPALFTWEQPVVSDERFGNLDLSVRSFIGRRWMLAASLPYADYRQHEAETVRRSSGVGDLSIGAMHLTTVGDSTSSKRLGQWVNGLAVKLPTGRFDARFGDEDLFIPNLQPGTGSVDVVLTSNLMKRFNRWAVQAQVSMRANGRNAEGYRFGHRAMGAVRVMRYIAPNENGGVLLPGVELGFAAAQRDLLNVDTDEVNAVSGGQGAQLMAGADYFRQRWGVGAYAGIPLWQNWGGGYLEQRAFASVQLSFLF